jgi:hypothetical protein
MKIKFYANIIGLFAIFFGVCQTGGGQTLAFPTAQGYGKYATGGRGGEVVVVTNLDDYNPDLSEKAIVGSFRWAFTQAKDSTKNRFGTWVYSWKPITVVFNVGGVISLKKELRVTRSNMTIAGQTAPGDGICFRGATVNFSGSFNVIVRNIRSRPGDELLLETSGFRIENGGNFIIDHCSFSWAIEETTHFSNNDNSTVQWCIISESLYNSIHKKGERGYGTQWGGEYASYHHNLLAHHASRMPRINGSNANDVNALVDYRNNVNYNWSSSGAFYGGEWEGTTGCTGYCHTNVVNNYFKPGPSTSGSTFAAPSLNRSGVTLCGYGQWYFNGNVMNGNSSKTNDNWLGVDVSAVGSASNIKSTTEFVKSDGVIEDYAGYTETAENTYTSVLSGVGATYPKRDVIDTRVIGEVKGDVAIARYEYTTADGQLTPVKGVSSGIIDSQNNLVPTGSPAGTTAWDVYTASTSANTDTDLDGMPDSWEDANGLNKNSAADKNKLTVSGYTALEVYLNGLVNEDIALDFGTTPVVETALDQMSVWVEKNRLRVETSLQIEKIEIVNASGQMVLSQPIEGDPRFVGIASLTPGFYIAKISMIEGVRSVKFLKTN